MYIHVYNTYSYTHVYKTSSLGKFYLLPKTNKSLFNVPVRPAISNFDTPTDKALEFLDDH